jgi:hypothetical protein
MAWRKWYEHLRRHRAAITAEYKTNGLRGVIKAYGWRLLLAVFVFYLIRDTILYIIIPLAAGRAIWQALTG